jgi:gliding motility-associated-like protein
MYRNVLLSIVFLPCALSAQLVVDNTTQTPAQLVQSLMGNGVTAFNVSFTGDAAQAGTFNGAQSNAGFPDGIILSSGNAVGAVGPNATSGSTMAVNSAGSDADLAMISGNAVFDVAILEFDFIPSGNQFSFSFAFGSEEYPEWVGTQWNDAFGFFLRGPGITGAFSGNADNIALLPDNVTPITISNVNANSNAGFFIDNGAGVNADPNVVQYDGLTVPLVASAQVQCGQVYHIKLAIGDVGDGQFDSGVFLEAGAFASPSISLAMSGDITAPCADQVNVSVQNVIGGNAPVNFQWSSQGVALGNAQTQSSTVGEAHFVVVNATDACGATAVDSVLVSPLPFSLVMPQDQTIACLASVDLTPQVQQAGANADLTFAWTAAGNNVGSAQSLSVNAPAQPVQFTLTVSDQCGSTATGSVQVSTVVNAPIGVTAIDDVTLPCSTESTELSVASVVGGDGNYSFTWTHDGTVIGNTQTIDVSDAETSYTVTVTDGCGAGGSDDVSVGTQQFPPVSVSVSEDLTVFCAGDNATVAMVGVQGGEAPYTMIWTDGDGTPVSQDPSFTVAVPVDATYALTITDQCGNSATDIVNVLAPDYAPLTVTVTPGQVVCAGNTVELVATPSGGSGVYTFNWPEAGATSSSITVSPTTASTFNVVVTEFCGATLSGAVPITIEEPVVNLVATNIGGEEWAFSAFATPAATGFAWDFGDGTASQDARPTHEYIDLLGHVAEVTITTANGCTATDTVHLNTESQFFLPNAFTPNGDGINDIFGPVGNDLVEFEMTIFNRWGLEVYALVGVGKTWDGRLANGEMAPQGVYVYRYKVSGERLPVREGLGHVTLTGEETAQN